MKKEEVRGDKKTRLAKLSGWLSQEFLMPTRVGLEGVDRPEVRDAVVGTEGLYCAVCRWIFALGENLSSA